MKRLFLLCWIACAAACATDRSEPVRTGIIPQPLHVERVQRGTLQLPETVGCFTAGWPQELPAAWPEGFAATDDPGALLHVGYDASIAAEGYRLTIARDAIRVDAADAAGLFYALQSVAQMAERFGRRIPCLKIDDAPRFPYRGMMLDVSRHFRDKEFVERQIDLMARYKLNRFHWHLTDGAGWRIEIDRYPELTRIAAWRPYPDWAAWAKGGTRYCTKEDPAADGGYYTKEEIREVIAYAHARQIEVIPEIEMPGHSEEVLAVYPQLACTGKPYTASDFCIGREETFEFLCNVLDEVIELFPSEYIHIGGDEASKRHWKECPSCQRRMREEGLADVDELQSYLVRRVERHLKSRGRKLLGWDEIIEGGLAPEATVMSWRGTEGGLEAARTGHHAIMTPGKYCYLDGCQDDPRIEPPASAAFLTLETAYSYDPAPDSLGMETAGMILGVQGNLWCEHIPTAEHAEHMLWPRMLAIAEVGWSDPAAKDYGRFLENVYSETAWMIDRGYHPFDQRTAVGPRPESTAEVESIAKGRPVTYMVPYSKYYPGAGDATLTDGRRGGWGFGDGTWQAWVGKDAAFAVDLGEVRPIGYVGIDFLQGRAAEIWMPREVEIALSEDGEHYTTVATVPTRTDFDEPSCTYETFAWEGEARGRYVRITARINKQRTGWLFTDEVIVR